MDMIKEENNLLKDTKDFLKDLGIIVIIVLIIRTFIAVPFQINGQSMYASYYDKEFIIVDRLSYRIGEPKR
jgi:signal peptidase I